MRIIFAYTTVQGQLKLVETMSLRRGGENSKVRFKRNFKNCSCVAFRWLTTKEFKAQHTKALLIAKFFICIKSQVCLRHSLLLHMHCNFMHHKNVFSYASLLLCDNKSCTAARMVQNEAIAILLLILSSHKMPMQICNGRMERK